MVFPSRYSGGVARRLAGLCRRNGTAFATSAAIGSAQRRPLTIGRGGPATIRTVGFARIQNGPKVRHFAQVTLKCPGLGGESITEGTIMEWKKKVGDAIRKDEVIVVIETDKVTVEVKAESDGVLADILSKADDTIQVGAPLAKINPGGVPLAAADSAEGQAKAAASAAVAARAPQAGHGHHDPLVGLRATFARNAAKRLGLPDPMVAATSTTTSPSVDATKAVATPIAIAAASTGQAAPGAQVVHRPAISVGVNRNDRRVPVSTVRRNIVSSMKAVQSTAALLTTFQEADMSKVKNLCEKNQDLFMKIHGTKLTLQAVIYKAAALSLLEEPGVNAIIDDTTSEIVLRDYVDLAVPVHSLRGPVSCVIRNVESRSIVEIQKQLDSLTARARKDMLTFDDLGGSTFSIQDTSAEGGWFGTGIVGPGQSASLSLNAVTQRAVAVGTKVEARPMMYMNLTYDHRLVDGREAVTFLVAVRDKLEDPSRMLIGL